jgi:uncharacterized damage-inducible protein DinB
MKQTLFIFLFLSTALSAVAQSDELHRNELQQKWLNARAYTLALADSMPADRYDFRPVEGEMSFSEQMVHLTANMVWLCSSYLTAAPPPLMPKEIEAHARGPKSEILPILAQSMDYVASTLKAFNPQQLNDPVRFFSGPMTKRQIMMLMNDHLTHHRAQAIVYLRLNEITPPRYVGW